VRLPRPLTGATPLCLNSFPVGRLSPALGFAHQAKLVDPDGDLAQNLRELLLERSLAGSTKKDRRSVPKPASASMRSRPLGTTSCVGMRNQILRFCSASSRAGRTCSKLLHGVAPLTTRQANCNSLTCSNTVASADTN
jgi:hypothetical protein